MSLLLGSSIGTPSVDSRFLHSRPSQCPGRAPCVSPSPPPGMMESEKDDNDDDVDEVKPFEAIPGPRSLPIIGTLHHYLPVIGQYTHGGVGVSMYSCLCQCISITVLFVVKLQPE